MSDDIFDVAVIGAGVTGGATAYALAKYNLKTAVIDREADVAMGSSRANSGILHGGFAAPPKSLKTKYNVMANPMFDEVCANLQVPFSRCGSFVVAISDEEVSYVEHLYEQGQEIGVPVELITDTDRIQEMEPELSKAAQSILYSPIAGVVSPYELCIRMNEIAAMNGATHFLEAPVESIDANEEWFNIHTPRIDIKARWVVNAAGLYSDKVEGMVGLCTHEIKAWKGEYIILDKGAIQLNHVLFPSPTKESKGIVVTPTAHGNVIFGPNNIYYEDREDVSTTTDGLLEVIEGGTKLIPNLPALQSRKAIRNFAGLRAKANTDDFVIGPTDIERFFNAAGIQSPGLSSCLAVGQDIVRMMGEAGLPLEERENYIGVIEKPFKLKEATPEEIDAKIKEDPRAGHVVCRCETVSELEIVEAIRRPVGAKTLDAVKTRVRPGMGRCQGGFCTPRVIKILSRELGVPMEEITQKGTGSQILWGRTKGLPSEVWHE
ncbi:MAG TPA: NAD(P)/FAD-dependent oxidoreductase [Candidatus Lokiarchaeia archaeon]|nr:NAD(P)/FAD-dependent oxidoreductase [Candidatus Lokiarchaeia archaeon]